MKALLALIALPVAAVSLTAQEPLNVLTPEMVGGPPKAMLTRWLRQQAFDALERRKAMHDKLKSPEQIDAYQKRLRSLFLESLGELPEKTPLHAKVVGVVPGERFRVEKVIFESQPRHYVCALVFVPEGKGPFPAVLMPAGHSASGKAENQIHGMFLARSGFIAMGYDPIGQGERHQFIDASGKSLVKSMTTEHTLIGAGSIPLGRSTATFRIWDGMRALDYLTSRPDVDSKRIGITGCSGGGTLTSYLMALDDRAAVAAPSCYITSWKRLLETIGPQDAEQNIFGQIAFGMDHADYIHLRAPKPTLILAASGDFFDIQGTWSTFREAQRLYTRLGSSERVAIVETDTKHGYPKAQREAMVRWMSRWLMNKDEAIVEPEGLTPRPTKDYWCTLTGEVMQIKGARNVADLNVELNAKYRFRRTEAWKPENVKSSLDQVRKLAGVRPLAKLPQPTFQSVGTVERKGYVIDRVHLEIDKGVSLPGLLFKPNRQAGEAVLYLHESGKLADAMPGGAIEKLCLQGKRVLALDVRGVGEIGVGPEGTWGGGWNDIFISYLLGQSLVGLRTEDILIAAQALAAPNKVELVAIGNLGVPALHAAALEPQLFAKVTLHRPLESWSGVVRNPTANGQLVNVVHGALKLYDLPDLRRAFPAGMLAVHDVVDVGR
jgi:dienelactone hydrolase